MDEKKCRCGCGSDAVWLVSGFDYDPRAPGGKGKAFKELCCSGSAAYLEESSMDLGFPCSKERIS